MSVGAQRDEALIRANEVRIFSADVKREIADGRSSFTEALDDERAQPMKIGALLLAQRRWGPTKARKLLAGLGISEHRRVRSLTSRQRRILVERVEGRA